MFISLRHGFPFVGCAHTCVLLSLLNAVGWMVGGGTPFLTHAYARTRTDELPSHCWTPFGSMPIQKIDRHRQAVDDYDVEEDLPNALKLLGEMNNNVKQVSDLVENMLQRVKTGELTTEYGLSFLEIKYHMLLTYLINLTYVVLRKCSGTYSPFANHDSIDGNQNPYEYRFCVYFCSVGRQANRTRPIHWSIDWDSNSSGENSTNRLQAALSNR